MGELYRRIRATRSPRAWTVLLVLGDDEPGPNDSRVDVFDCSTRPASR
jgi:hypothetical protein